MKHPLFERALVVALASAPSLGRAVQYARTGDESPNGPGIINLLPPSMELRDTALSVNDHWSAFLKCPSGSARAVRADASLPEPHRAPDHADVATAFTTFQVRSSPAPRCSMPRKVRGVRARTAVAVMEQRRSISWRMVVNAA
ncbi:MAG TPA: hypothetical protein PKE21_10165 [Flavobacteriales bacterium]|nr:hypothetical protein [Flavobacteriales bacterium]HMR27831.1 hypothetical protein [Flavobacteriales bacterium]